MFIQVRRIDTSTMPLMSLAATAIDQPQHRDVVIETMLQYVATDPIICRMEPGVVADKQHATLNPILEWATNEIGVRLEPTDSIFGAELSFESADKIRQYLKRKRWKNQIIENCLYLCVIYI